MTSTKTCETLREGREAFDDTTALCLRYIKLSKHTPLAIKTIEMRNNMSQISAVISDFEAFAEKYNVPMEVLMKMNLVFDDILSNVVQYAYTDKEQHTILIDCKNIFKRTDSHYHR